MYTKIRIFTLYLYISIITIEVVDTKLINANMKFEKFIQKYNKLYIHDKSEYNRRLKIFKSNLHEIERLNQNRSTLESAEYGVTQFSDQTADEFSSFLKRRHLTQNQVDSNLNDVLSYLNELSYKSNESGINVNVNKQHMIDNSLPLLVDWREKGVVSPVISQGRCGACWAHSVIETIESMIAIKRGRNYTENLSVQQAIDCSRSPNYGCQGGNTCALLKWYVNNNITIASQYTYPLLSNNWEGECKIESAEVGPRIHKYTCEK